MPQYTDSTGLTWNYTLSGGNASIGTGGNYNYRGNATTLGENLSGAITIPSTITDGGVTYNVTGIGQFAFYQCTSLTSIDLSGTQVTTIGQSAFDMCTSLTSIIIPNSLTTIGERVFWETNLNSIDLSGTQVTTIETLTFYKCYDLTSIDFPNSLTTIGSSAFKYCSSLTSIDLSETQVTTIGSEAFNVCSSLTSVDLGNSLTTIGSRAFLQCTSLTSIDLLVTQVTTIEMMAFYYCSSLETIDLGDSLTTIGSNAFYRCSITSITIPDSVTTIGQSAFYRCSSLTSITIHDSVTSIGSSAFSNIGSPSTVYVRDVDPTKTMIEGLEYIGGPGRDHGSDGGLMDGKITGTVAYVSLTSTPIAPYLSNVSFAYDGTTKYSATVVSNDLEGDNFTFSLSGADAASFNLTTYDACNNALLESVDPWDLNAPFAYSVTIKATDSTDLSATSLFSIAKTLTATELFTNNISGSTLKTLADQSSVSPKDLYDVGYTVDQLVAAGFQYWNYTLDASNNATIGTGGGYSDSGNATFLGTSLSGAITIPSTITDGGVTYNVTGIGRYAFYQCSNLTSITIPDSLTTIVNNYTFARCSTLTSITVDANNNSFSDINGVLFNKDQSTLIHYPIGKTATSYTFPDSVTTIDTQAFYACTSLTSIDLSGVTTIGTYAFGYCSSFTSIDLPNSLTTLGTSAFRSCSSLTSITIPDSVTTINRLAFYSIGSPSTFYVKGNVQTIQTLVINSYVIGTVTYTQWVEPNYAPTTPTLSDISCNENTPYTATVSATDDNGDALTFSLSGTDSADFTLTGTTLSANAVFDFETKATYNITITASDGSLNTSADFTITVNNVVEAPELFNANVQGTELKTSADNVGITSQQLLDAGYTSQHLLDAGYLHSDICFVEGTPVNTDQGTVAIDKLDVSKHTIRGKPIVAVTKTISEEKHLVCIRKDALAKNVPSQDTLTTQNHTFFYNGNMVKAKHLVNKLDNAVLVKYDGSTLYNVLQDKHEKMVVNNLIAETLHPNHCIAQIYRYFAENKVSPEMQQKAIASLRKDQVNKKLTK